VLGVLVAVILGPRNVAAQNAVYDYQVDQFQVDGNTFGKFDGTPDFVDDFSKTTISPWIVSFGTASESGGFLHLTNPGTLVDAGTYLQDRSDVYLPTLLRDGSGDFTATARWTMTIPLPEQVFSFAIADSTAENLSVGIYKHGTELRLFQLYQTSIPTSDSQMQIISPSDVTGAIVFRIAFDDASNMVTTSVSLDGGTTFLSPFTPQSYFNHSSIATFVLHANQTYPEPCKTPAVGCRTARHSSLLIRNASNDKQDRVAWRWSGGQPTAPSELGNPTELADYTLCIYTGSSEKLLAQLSVIADPVKWKIIKNKGYKYTDKTASVAGVTNVVVSGSPRNNSLAALKGKGVNLPRPTLGSLPLPVTAQLVNSSTDVCFEAQYDGKGVLANRADLLKARAP